MRALRACEPGMPPEIGEVPEATAAPGEVVVDVRAAGICGSDRHIIAGKNPSARFPIVLGHEIVGEVATVDPSGRFAVGDLVSVNFLVSCAECTWCVEGRANLCARRVGIGIGRDGGLAESVAVPVRNLIAVPPGVDLAWAAIATDAFATPLHAIRRSDIRPEHRVLIIGAGGLGLSAILILRAMGITLIDAVDVDPAARAVAERVGAQHVSAPADAQRDAEGHFYERVLDMVGSAGSLALATSRVGIGGRITIVGLGDEPLILPPASELVRSEITVTGSYAFESDDIVDVLAMMAARQLDAESVIGRRITLDEAGAALDPRHPHPHPGRTVVVMKK